MSPSIDLNSGTFKPGRYIAPGTFRLSHAEPKNGRTPNLLKPTPYSNIGRVAVVYRPIAELKLDPRNPRRHSPRQINQIAGSIKNFGFNVPVLIDASLNVVAGHGRIMAARVLGLSDVPTISLEHLSEAQARAFKIADNRLTDNSVWDDRLLAQQLKELSILDLDFNLEVTGFEVGEIDLRIQGLECDGEANNAAEAIPAATADPPVSCEGDLWALGKIECYAATRSTRTPTES